MELILPLLSLINPSRCADAQFSGDEYITGTGINLPSSTIVGFTSFSKNL
jgi:hypothetical protein